MNNILNAIPLSQFITLAIALFSGIVAFAYKFPESYKSFKPVKTTFIFGSLFFIGYIVWLEACLILFGKIEKYINPNNLKEANETLKSILIDNFSFTFFICFWLFLLIFFYILCDLDSLLKKDKKEIK